ncbi:MULTISPECIES: polysaccharide biosynthesis tyrosine autokinase [unclassified Moraxella]|uniref:polysaccharide biosynthesis tyrosine autokinase n=1 Tax=unclassified Moraxella TaxID=2685852 RepID=UPI003AF92EBC
MSSKEAVDDEIDLRALLGVLLNYWKMIVACLLLGLLAGVFYAKTATPVYRTNALLQVDKKSQGVSALGADVADLLQAEGSSANTEIELLKSRMVLWPVIESSHLDISLAPTERKFLDKFRQIKNNQIFHDNTGIATLDERVSVADFNVAKDYYGKAFTLVAEGNQQFRLTLEDKVNIKGYIGKPTTINTKQGPVSILVNRLPPKESFFISQQAPANATNSLRGSLNIVEQGKNTGILTATMDGVNQDEITQTLTKIVTTYKQQNEDKSSAETSKTLAFMQEQLPKLQQQLNEAQIAFNQFRQKNGTVDIDKEAELIVGQRTAIQTSLRELELKRAELAERYTDEYPVLKQINAQIAELKDKDKALSENITRIPEVQRQFLDLSNEVKISSEIYLTMLKNYQQLQIVKSGQMGYVRIVDLPISTDKPIAPKKSQIVLLASLLGLMLGVGLAFLRSLLNVGVKDVKDLEDQIDVPVIAVIPKAPRLARLTKNKRGNKSALLERVEPDSVSNEAIKSLRTHLLFDSKHEKGNKLLITGASPGIGKSFVSANLAVAMAMSGKKVLLIDADARLGHLHDYFHQVNDYGVVDYLTEANTMQIPSKLIQKTSFDGLDLIPRGRYQKNTSELFLNDGMKNLLAQVSDIYDYILIDTSPVMGTSDALSVGQLVDQVLFVTRYGVSTAKQVEFAVERLQRANIPVTGIVFNGTEQSIINSYNYHYGYDYKAK